MKEIRYNLKVYIDDEKIESKALKLDELFIELDDYFRDILNKNKRFRYEIEQIEVI